VHELCREHGILFVADEVQTGFARTGSMFAIDAAGVVPDVIVMAKGIASGFPISAIGASTELMARWPKGSHGGTYGGNPIGCAAALATIDVLTEPGFVDAVNARGEQLRAGLRTIVADHGLTAEVRGPGLMVGLELGDAAHGEHDSARIGQVIAHCRDEGHVLLMNAGTYGNVVRFMPPLVVTGAEVQTALDAVAAAVAATA
jgi:4-aminobutyrate aminotransferase-like enzyme